MPLQSCRIKDAFKTPGARRCESQGGVRGSVGGGVWEGWQLGGWRGGSCFPSGACLNGALATCLSGRCRRRRGSGIFLWDSPSRPSSKFLQEHVSRMNPAPSLHTCKRLEPSPLHSKKSAWSQEKGTFPQSLSPHKLYLWISSPHKSSQTWTRI